MLYFNLILSKSVIMYMASRGGSSPKLREGQPAEKAPEVQLKVSASMAREIFGLLIEKFLWSFYQISS